MNKHFSIRKLSIAALSAMTFGLGAMAGLGPSVSADAESTTGTFRLTFNGQTTSPAFKSVGGLQMEAGVVETAGKDGGYPEYTWKVQRGEDALIPVLLPIKYDNGN